MSPPVDMKHRIVRDTRGKLVIQPIKRLTSEERLALLFKAMTTEDTVERKCCILAIVHDEKIAPYL